MTPTSIGQKQEVPDSPILNSGLEGFGTLDTLQARDIRTALVPRHVKEARSEMTFEEKQPPPSQHGAG